MKPIGCEASVGLSFVSEERLDENVGVFTSEEAQTAITWVRNFRNLLTVSGFYLPLTSGCSVMGIEYLADV